MINAMITCDRYGLENDHKFTKKNILFLTSRLVMHIISLCLRNIVIKLN